MGLEPMDEPIRILGRAGSINVRKVLWTAAETGVPFVHEAEWGDSKDLRSRPAARQQIDPAIP
jgi:hypothetical protein